MREIPLTKGKVAIVDDEDYVRLAKYKWYLGNEGYARRGSCINGKYIAILMHREIMQTPKSLYVDHINGDKLDNRKENLRNCTQSQNQMNQHKQLKPFIQFKGIWLCKRSNSFVAAINISRKKKYIGAFKTQLEAAKAYDQAAVKYFGEYARLNFPESKEVIQRSNQITLF